MKDISLTISGLLLLVFAILPGLPGERLYHLLVGANWREDHWQRVLRLLGFSLFGVTLYARIAPIVGAPPPPYLSPAVFQGSVADPNFIDTLAIALLGHFAASGLGGLLAGSITRVFARLFSATVHPSAWDHFIRDYCAKGQRIVVGLESGEYYSGLFDMADLSVSNSEREIVLREPAILRRDHAEYVAMGASCIFLSSKLIVSIAIADKPPMLGKDITSSQETDCDPRESNRQGEIKRLRGAQPKRSTGRLRHR